MSDFSELSGRDDQSSKVGLRIDDRVARISLNNPPLNTLTIEMMGQITQAVNQAAREHGLCAIVFEVGPKCRAFSAGVALEDHTPEVAYQLIDSFHSIFRTLDFQSRPTVAIVPDSALGAGCELAAYCDIVIASEKARFGLPQIKMGVFPPLACVYFPRIVGQKRAREMILTGTLLTAEEARQCGLVSHVVPDDQLTKRADEVLDKLRSLSASVLETTRRALVECDGVPLEDALLKVEDLYLNQLMNLRDPREGLVAFLEKRQPSWRHR